MIAKLAELKKLIVYLLGIASQLVTLGLVPDPERGWLMTVLAVATGAGIYIARNTQPAASIVAVPVSPTSSG